jgi:hypothetical protein
MYQTLICRIVGRDGRRNQPCCFSATLDAKLFQGAAYALVDRMWADTQLGRDFLAVVVPVDQQKALDLPLAETRNGRLRTNRTGVPLYAIRYHHEHQHSFRAGNKCRNLRFPANLLVESAEMLKF